MRNLTWFDNIPVPTEEDLKENFDVFEDKMSNILEQYSILFEAYYNIEDSLCKLLDTDDLYSELDERVVNGLFNISDTVSDICGNVVLPLIFKQEYLEAYKITENDRELLERLNFSKENIEYAIKDSWELFLVVKDFLDDIMYNDMLNGGYTNIQADLQTVCEEITVPHIFYTDMYKAYLKKNPIKE